MKVEYHKAIARKILLLVVCVIGIVLFVGILSLSNYEGVGLKETYQIIWNHICGNEYPLRSLEWWADKYIWNTALPHALAAIVAGAALAICGPIQHRNIVRSMFRSRICNHRRNNDDKCERRTRNSL